MKLTIAILFCDKDKQIALKQYSRIRKIPRTYWTVLLADNCKKQNFDYAVDPMDSAVALGGLSIMESRKKILEYCNSIYIWYIDGDDEIINPDSWINLDLTSEADVICFNYIEKYARHKIRNLTADFDIAMDSGLWNKFIKKDSLSRVYDLICCDFQTQEDTLALLILRCMGCKFVRQRGKPIYKYNRCNAHVKLGAVLGYFANITIILDAILASLMPEKMKNMAVSVIILRTLGAIQLDYDKFNLSIEDAIANLQPLFSKDSIKKMDAYGFWGPFLQVMSLHLEDTEPLYHITLTPDEWFSYNNFKLDAN